MSREITLTNGRIALVDDEDFVRLNGFRWRAINPKGALSCYAVTGQKRPQSMHGLIMGLLDGYEIDHKSRDGLDNRRANLRWATRAQNTANRTYPVGVSGYRGVSSHRGLWRAKIMVQGKQILIGDFAEPIYAAAAYDRAATAHVGEFAMLNFSRERDWILPFPSSPSRGAR